MVLPTTDGCYSADRVITFRFIFHNIVFLFVFVAYFRMLTILNNKWPHKSTIKILYLKEWVYYSNKTNILVSLHFVFSIFRSNIKQSYNIITALVDIRTYKKSYIYSASQLSFFMKCLHIN